MISKILSVCIRVFILLLPALPAEGQVTYYPIAEKQDVKGLSVKWLEITENYTIIDFFFQPEEETIICLDKAFYITPAGMNDPHFMIMAKQISICPKSIKIDSYNKYLEFKVWFPKLEKNIRKIDIIENKKNRNGFNMYRVPIINGQETPSPDSLDINGNNPPE